jgi:adenosylhomocysteine nucleosidase
MKPEMKLVAGHRILYVMATLAEYHDALKALFCPLICQVGPVEAALHLSQYLATHEKPDLIVSLGSAGSAVLEQAKVYQVSSVSYRDMDASSFGFEKGTTPFLDLPAEVKLSHQIPNIASARLSTGANVVSGEAYKSVDAEMVDMETWAIMRVCMAFDVPLIGLRGISDGAEPVSEYSDWSRYLEVIDEQLAEAVDSLETAIANAELTF